MASRVPHLTKLASNMLKKATLGGQVVAKRQMSVYSKTGALDAMPDVMKLPNMKVIAVVVPFLIAGANSAKNGAAFLEENDIFVPDDDDD